MVRRLGFVLSVPGNYVTVLSKRVKSFESCCKISMGAMRRRRARWTVRRPAGFWERASGGLAFCAISQVERSSQVMDIF